MKKILTTIIAFLIALNCYSQTDTLYKKNKSEIDVNYNWSHIGRSLNINYSHYFGQHAIIIGIKQHYNSVIIDNQHYYYKNRGHAENFSESIGLNIG